jgi:thiol-disulfide isomerase/thioredoxin
MIQHINKIFPIILLIILVTGCKQSQFYRFFYEKDLNDSIYTQEQFDILLEEMRNALPQDYSLTPIVFHRYQKKDSIINFVSFKKIWWGDKNIDLSNFDLVYKQDSLYTFLDKKLPDFELTDLDGKLFNSNQLIGKPTLINFWQTNCRGCIAEMPQLDILKEKYKDSVNFISISNDRKDFIIMLLSSRGFTFKQLLDDQDYIKETLNISGFPTNLFLDRKGILREIKNSYEVDTLRLHDTGYLDEYEEILNKILKL